MGRDVIVSIMGNHMVNDENNPVEILSKGKLYTRNGKTHIRYDETDAENNIINCAIIYDDASVHIRRSDSLGINCMIFEKDRNCVTSYQTPFGKMIAGFSTRRLDITRDKNGESIMIDYMLDINYTYVSDCNVEIRISYI